MSKTITIRRTRKKKHQPVTTTAAEFQALIEKHFIEELKGKYEIPPWLFSHKEKTRRAKREKPAFEFTLAWYDLETTEKIFSATEAIEVQLFDDEFNARRLGSAWGNAINLKLGLVKAKRFGLHRADEPQYID